MKKAFSILLLVWIPLGLFARGSWTERFEAGVEWGYGTAFYDHYHYNYYSSDYGSRVDSRESFITSKSIGHAYVFAGYRFTNHFSAGLKSGWIGAYEGRRMTPVMATFNYVPRGFNANGWKYFTDLGYCFADNLPGKSTLILRGGAGRRIMLDRKLCMDLSASLQGVSDHPGHVYDALREQSVPTENLLRSDCIYIAVNFSVAICF